MIMAGEASGDLHGAGLAREIRKADPSIALCGVGSVRMREAGVTMLADASDISVVGLTEVIKHLGGIFRTYRALKSFLTRERPDLLVLIDLPDFNILLGKAAKKIGIPIVYYISPQVWAWRKGRIKTIARLVNAMIVIFPFEEPLYRKEGVDVRYVGHPLTDVVGSSLTKEEAKKQLGLDPARRTVALLPGSRKTEIVNLLPEMLAAAKILLSRFQDLQFVLPVAPTLGHDFIGAFVKKSGVPVTLTGGKVYDALQGADAAIVASGTATLETGLMGVPMVIVYRISDLTYYILSKLVSGVEHVGLVNIVAGKRLVPELIQHDANALNMADAITRMLEDAAFHEQIRSGLAGVRAKLGSQGASGRAAAVVIEMLRKTA